jgi:hypothetical protein
MFLGFSLTKLIFTALVIAAIWHVYKFFGRLQDVRIRTRKEENLKRRAGAEAAKRPDKIPDGTEDMTECPLCATFVVASGAEACGREDCPYKVPPS